MQAEERQLRIEEYLQKAEFSSLDELARQVNASVSTVRRDVSALETQGKCRRTHGGARILTPRSDEFTFTTRDSQQVVEKEAIGKACAALVQPGQSVIMDAGSTIYHVARYLQDKKPQIVTNSLPIANLYASDHLVEIILSGGVIYPRLGVLVGPLAAETFAKMHADVAIMSANGITPEGVFNSHALLIEIQQAMIQSAQKVIFCFDHTKLNHKAVSFLCELDRIDTVVTDQPVPPDLLDAFRRNNIEVVLP
ncbi:MAG: DeoR/GlpR family DNA-binding transcription regulator [Verrucomicrobiae bacterium]|nr:DeoR/GlpR family DNA-binding transcription regulator [Verrucomicrobiae bacterium]